MQGFPESHFRFQVGNRCIGCLIAWLGPDAVPVVTSPGEILHPYRSLRPITKRGPRWMPCWLRDDNPTERMARSKGGGEWG